MASNNKTVQNNILYKNKYGIYVKPGYFNNTFIFNDFLENEIAASDLGNNNSWNSSIRAEGLLERLMVFLTGERMKGNYYSNYDEPEEDCNDTDDDGFCDLPRNISGGSSVDLYPSTEPFQISF